jgi:hypothetical protein
MNSNLYLPSVERSARGRTVSWVLNTDLFNVKLKVSVHG